MKLLDVGHLVPMHSCGLLASGTDAFGNTIATVENAAARTALK